jgi:C-terminal processing protease CtpA/Prc
LKPGDIVIELDGTVVKGRSLDDVVYMLERLNGTVKFKVFRGENTIPMETFVS